MLSIVASILYNSSRQKGARAYKPEDFIPQYGKKPVAENLEVKLRAILNGNN